MYLMYVEPHEIGQFARCTANTSSHDYWRFMNDSLDYFIYNAAAPVTCSTARSAARDDDIASPD
jgi:hypothetical protein